MRISAPTRLLAGTFLLWATGRLLGVSLGSIAVPPTGGPIVAQTPIAVVPSRVASAPAQQGRGRSHTGRADPRTAPPGISVATSVARAPANAAGAPLLPPVEAAAAIADAQWHLLERLEAPRSTYGLAQRWRWRDSGFGASYAAASRQVPDRWNLSAWGVGRDGRSPSAAIAPTALGGSQIGARIAYRIGRNGRWEAFARANSSGRLGDGAEAAIGIAWQPLPAIPARLTVERRQQLVGSGSRNDVAVYASGGVSQMPLGADWRLDGYGAAGVVGVSDPLPFAEAQVAATHSIARRGRLTVSGGGGIWAAAQSGAARIDVGPRLSVDAGAGAPRIALDWRQRVAGNATPASGPALTVGMDF